MAHCIKRSWKLKYIDNGLGGEVVCNVNAPSHITHKKEVKLAHAAKSEQFLKLTAQNAARIGMKINISKTKLLCITVAKNSMVNTYINASKKEIISGSETLKMLGFVFGRRPNAQAHVTYIKKKFYGKLWILRNLMKANTAPEDLSKIYQTCLLYTSPSPRDS